MRFTERNISMLTHSKGSSPLRLLNKRSLALTLVAAMLCPPGGLLVAAQAQQIPPPVPQAAPAPPAPALPAGSTIHIPTAPAMAGPIHSILLFPFANNISASGGAAGFNPEQVGARVEDAIKLRLNVIGRYKANSFSPSLPQIQRALQEARVEGLSENDLTPPYDDAQKTHKIAAQVGTDGYMLGTIEALRADPSTRNVSLTVSATLYNSATGTATRVLAFTGKSVSYNPSDDPDSLLQSAINDVAGQVVSALNGSLPQERMAPVDYQRGRHNNNGSILLGILLATAVGIAIGSSHHGGGGGSTTTTTTPTGSGGPPSPPGLNSGNNPSGPPAAPNP
jgi:hypothetical protein